MATPFLDRGTVIEAWVRVATNQNATVLQNDTQYSITLDANGRVSCRIGGDTATTSESIGTNVWRHVACTLSSEKLAVHLEHALGRLDLTDKRIGAGGDRSLLTGVQMADQDNDRRGRASIAEFVKSIGGPAGK